MKGDLTKNFSLSEFIHPDILENPAIGRRCENYLHDKLVPTCQAIRDNVGGLTINNWNVDGGYHDSGLRQPYHEPSQTEIMHIINTAPDNTELCKQMKELFKGIGAKFSGHKFGVCADLKPSVMTPQELYFHILDNKEIYPYIVRMEHIDLTPTWVHIEVGKKRNPNQSIDVIK